MSRELSAGAPARHGTISPCTRTSYAREAARACGGTREPDGAPSRYAKMLTTETRLEIDAIEGLAVLGENALVADLYPQASEITTKIPTIIFYGLMTQTVAGIAAAAGEQWDEAVEAYESIDFPRHLEMAKELLGQL